MHKYFLYAMTLSLMGGATASAQQYYRGSQPGYGPRSQSNYQSPYSPRTARAQDDDLLGGLSTDLLPPTGPELVAPPQPTLAPIPSAPPAPPVRSLQNFSETPSASDNWSSPAPQPAPDLGSYPFQPAPQAESAYYGGGDGSSCGCGVSSCGSGGCGSSCGTCGAAQMGYRPPVLPAPSSFYGSFNTPPCYAHLWDGYPAEAALACARKVANTQVCPPPRPRRGELVPPCH
jgi:hypothetical protein